MENDKIDLRKYIKAIKKGWIWGLISFIVVLGLTITYCVIKMPQYESYASMLIENDSDNSARSLGGMASLMRTFSIGGFGKSSVDNEIVIVKSHAVKKATSSRLGLNRTYVERKCLKKELLYKTSPILVEAPIQLFDTLQTTFKIRLNIKGDKVDVTATKGFLSRTIASKENAMLPCSFETPYGTFQLLKSDTYQDGMNRTIDVIVSGDDIVASNLGKDVLTIDFRTKKSDAIELTILDPSKERGRDIINTMMSLYNERRSDRKNERAASDVAFLDKRIAMLNVELTQSEEDLEQFKNKATLVDVKAEVPVLLKQDVAVNEELLKLQVEEMTLKSMLEQLNDPRKKYTLMPMSESLGDKNAAVVIENYNELIMKRNVMLKSAKEGNVALQRLTDQIDDMRANAKDNVVRLLEQWSIKYDKVSKESNKFKDRISSLPQYEREYIDLARERELKNALYMFLIEKRESALLKQNNTQELGFIFEPAYSAVKPYMTKLYIILGVGIMFALIAGLFLAIYVGVKYNK